MYKEFFFTIKEEFSCSFCNVDYSSFLLKRGYKKNSLNCNSPVYLFGVCST